MSNTNVPSDPFEEDDELIKAMLYDLEHPGEIAPDPNFMVNTDEHENVDVSRFPTQPLQ